ncbi:MAG: prevent-host-death family protein [Candidatus Rokuibacteriota bacterium]|nr:MAG: prevent-host-death family protein [Candidatus Rokubacteria bacterium]PYN91759.1 MAG: prevent-host-death family protein [Candidatus Rokubacteria bacterium]
MMKMGLREANQKFSKAIRAVKAGEEVVLTERGKPIAVIRPLARANGDEGALRRLEAAGLLQRATKPGPMPPFRPIRIKGEPTSETIRKMRDER